MTDENIDFDQLIDLLDRALTSKDPRVMKALKKFLFIAALATEDTEAEGPFRNIIRRIEALEAQSASKTYTWPPTTGQWPPGSGTQIWYNASDGMTHKYNPTPGTAADFFDNYTTTTSAASDTLVTDTLNDLDQMIKESNNLQKD